jgi:heptosyltransferase-2
MEFDTVPYAPTPGKLVILAPNWLGDAVMALPALSAVRRGLPAARLAVAATSAVAPLYSLVDGVDEVMVLPRRGAAGRRAGGDAAEGGTAVERLLRARFDAALLLPNSFQSALTVWRAGVPERWGYRTDFRGPLLTRGVPPPPRMHQVGRYTALVGALGFHDAPAEPRLDPSETLRRAGIDRLRAAGWDGRPIVAMAPGAAGGGAKQWPAGSFAALATALAHDGAATLLVGASTDRAAASAVAAGVGPGVPLLDLVGGTDLPSLAGVLVNCRALVSNDSGAMHFGAALGLPVTAFFGPTIERETRPLGRVEPVVLTRDVWCRPCMLRECPLDHRCMRGIGVDAALAAARRSL